MAARVIGRVAVFAIGIGLFPHAGCSRVPKGLTEEERGRLVMKADSPAVAATALPQPRLREVLDHLAERGVVKEDVTVFELSHWLMYRRPMEDEDPLRPRYEAATFDYAGTRIALRIGPTTEPWQVPTPAEQDLLVRSKSKHSDRPDGATVLVKGQEWAVGYSMRDVDAEGEKMLTGLLVEWTEKWREAAEQQE